MKVYAVLDGAVQTTAIFSTREKAEKYAARTQSGVLPQEAVEEFVVDAAPPWLNDIEPSEYTFPWLMPWNCPHPESERFYVGYYHNNGDCWRCLACGEVLVGSADQMKVLARR